MKTLETDIELGLGAFQLRARFTAPGTGITVLFGPSGGGKTTLLSAIAGLRRPDRGSVRLGGMDVTGLAPHQRGIGLVFQDARLFPHLTVRQNIAYAAHRAPQGALPLQEAAGFFDIQHLLDRPVRNLSGGERNRVALARALASRPDFLLLDEPFAALDRARRHAFIRVLLDTHRHYSLPMMVVTHDIDDAAALSRNLVALKNGEVITEGSFVDAARRPPFQALLDARDIGSPMPVAALRSLHGGESLWLRADQVLLMTQEPHGVSARNVLTGEVRTVIPESETSLLVELETPAGMVLSRVTPDAVIELGLEKGKRAWIPVKVHAL
jgi:molybdate transport system ATP-binding protein